MTDPAAISALAEALEFTTTHLTHTSDEPSDADWAADILGYSWTPAQRAALAAELLTPEVLAEALAGTGTYDFSTPRKYWNPLYQPFMNAFGARILAALRDAGREPDHD